MSEAGGRSENKSLPDLRPGSLFAGYRIERVLDRGGMGIVYKATDLELERTVALKLIAPEQSHDPVVVARFKEEARLAASLEHPNVVPIHRGGEHNGVLYLAMRYVPGTTLRDVIAHAPMDLARVGRIVRDVAAALDATHESGLVHRDVKPANILVTGEGANEHAYLADFGLTKRLGVIGDLTRTGDWVGTPDYLAPEQIHDKELDPRADVYSLGCVVYEMLTGDVPYPRGSYVAKLFAHVTDPPALPRLKRPDLGRKFDAVVSRATAKEPADRYASAGALAADLGAAIAGEEERRRAAMQETRISPAVRLPHDDEKASTRAASDDDTMPSERARVRRATPAPPEPPEEPARGVESAAGEAPMPVPGASAESGGKSPQDAASASRAAESAPPERASAAPDSSVGASRPGGEADMTKGAYEGPRQSAGEEPPADAAAEKRSGADDAPSPGVVEAPPRKFERVPPSVREPARQTALSARERILRAAPTTSHQTSPETTTGETPRDTTGQKPPDAPGEKPPDATGKKLPDATGAKPPDNEDQKPPGTNGKRLPESWVSRHRWKAAGGAVVAVAAVVAGVFAFSNNPPDAPPPPSKTTSPPPSGQIWPADLDPVPTNHVNGAGQVEVRLSGATATVTVRTDELLDDVHAMHIHADGLGRCPPPSAARRHNGLRAIGAQDGVPFYGRPVTSLTTRGDTSVRSFLALPRFPTGGSIRYKRKIDLGGSVAGFIRQGNATVVVHGIDYNRNGRYDGVLQGIPNPPVSQETTAPAICGVLRSVASSSGSAGGSAGRRVTAVYTASLPFSTRSRSGPWSCRLRQHNAAV